MYASERSERARKFSQLYSFTNAISMHLLTITNTNLRVSTMVSTNLTVNALLGMIVLLPLGICPLCVCSQNCVPLGAK